MALQQTTGFWPVVAAIGGNALVTLSKFAAALASGSSSMYSETVHSFADTLNQTLLLIGLRRSLKKADDWYEYGYGRERFFWALISACGVFFVGAGVTAFQGFNALIHPEPLDVNFIIFAVLAFGLAVESYTLRIALHTIKNSFPDATWKERLQLADPMTLAVCLEDAVAVSGVAIAAIAIALSYLTGDQRYDAYGSLIISLFLAATAVVLIMKNREYLLGRAMPEELQEEVIAFLVADPAIDKVIDFKSSVVSWGVYRIKCEVEFNGGVLLRDVYRKKKAMERQFEDVKVDLDAFKRFVANFADRMPRLIGKRIDDIEKRLREKYPMIRHIDIEVN